MKKIGNITLYKLGEVVDILGENFNYHTTPGVLCKKITSLNAYVTYQNLRYIPESIIQDLTVVIKKKK